MNLIFLCTLFGAIQLCLSANILFLIPMPAKSHYYIGERLIRELIKKGNRVTLVSSFHMSNPPKGLTEIVIPDLQEKFSQSLKLKEPGEDGKFGLRKMTPLAFLFVSIMGEILLKSAMEAEPIQYLLKSNEKFDLVVGECFLLEGLLGGFAHRFNAPMVAIATFMPNIWPNAMVGNPAPASYIPEPILPYTNKMSFLERVNNFVYGLLAEVFYHLKHIPNQDALMRKYFGDQVPPLKDLIRNTSLVLVNHHYGVSFPRAYLPNMVEVGGLHVKPPEPLPKDLKTFMDGAKDGVILFSMGSNLESSQFPDEKIRGILKAFSKLKQRVLWKFERENLPDKPKNVLISKWLPQSDILGHPNTKLFITHGGILSITEAVMRAVPLVAVPIYGDQPANVNFILELELGVKMDYDDIKEETIIEVVNEVLSNPKYARNMKHRSAILRDVPVPQIDNAVFWIEYVMRYKGAPQLRSSAQDMHWFQLYLIDVLGFLGLIIFIILFLFWKLLKCCKGVFSKGKPKAIYAKKKK